MPGAGALLALLGGWLGTFLLGALFATATAIWVTAAGVALVPWLEKLSGMATSFLHERQQKEHLRRL
jgi:hypothetical protein